MFLDIGQSIINPAIGLTRLKFEEPIKKALKGKHNVFVMTSIGDKQVPRWSAPELGVSVFAYFVANGLQGYADGVRQDERRDGWVSLQELHAYVQHQVSNWVAVHRNSVQNPLLISEATVGRP